MTDKQATSTKVAEAILADLRGAAFYNDPKILAEFLQDQYGRSPAISRASEVADAILADLRGGYAYYKDPKILAEYLRGNFGGA